MYFTQEDLKKILDYLLLKGAKDTSFPLADRPLIGDELIAIILDDYNKLLSVQLLAEDVSSFINIEGFNYVGMATPSTVPISSTHGIFYIAGEAGTYPNFGNAVLDGTVLAIFKRGSKSDSPWITDFLGVRLDAIKVALDAKAIADLALATAERFKNDLVIALDTARNAELAAKAASLMAADAAEKADSAVLKSDRGVPGGIPILDETGKVPLSLLPLTKTELIDSYLSDDVTKAPTAAALHRLYLYHEEDAVALRDILNAVLDLVSDSSEMGVAPLDLKITSAAQSVKIQIVCNGTWNITEIPLNITASALTGSGNSVVTLSFPANTSTTNDITGSVKIVNSFGKEKTVNYTQYSAAMRYIYSISAVPEYINVGPSAGSSTIKVTSIKTPYINDTPFGDPEEVAYNVTRPDDTPWVSVTAPLNNNTTFTYQENILEAARSSKLVITLVDPKGVSMEVPITQAKAVVNTIYKFAIEPEGATIIDNGAGKTYPIKVISTKTVTVNSLVTTSEVPYTVSYSGDASSDWISYDRDKNSITLPFNDSTVVRTGSIVFTQERAEAPTITVKISLAIPKIEWNYNFEYSPKAMEFGNSAGSKAYSVTKSTKQKLINGVPSGEPIYVTWDVSVTGDKFILNKEKSTISVNENATLDTITGELIFTRAELGDEGNRVVKLSQTSGTASWEYNLSVSADPASIPAGRGTTKLMVISNKLKLINGKPSGDPIAVSWHGVATKGLLTGADVSGATWTMQDNQTESAREDTIVVNQLESDGKLMSVTVTLVAGVKVYNDWGNIRGNTGWTSGSAPTIAASGGSAAISNKETSISHYWSWNGIGDPHAHEDVYTKVPTLSVKSGPVTLSGNTVSIGNNTSTSTRSFVILSTADFSSVGYPSGTITGELSGQLIAGAQNTLRWGAVSWNGCNLSTGNIAASGGNSIVNSGASTLTRFYKWNNTGSELSEVVTKTPSISISSSNGFTLSGNTITIANNTWTATRSATVTWSANFGNGNQSKTETITQSPGVLTFSRWGDASISVPLAWESNTNFTNSGDSKSFTYGTASAPLYYKWNNTGSESSSIVTAASCTPSISGAGFSLSGNTVSVGNNTSTSTRSVSISLNAIFKVSSNISGGSDKTANVGTISKTLSAGAIVYAAWNVNISANTTSIGASGGSATISSSATRAWTWNGIAGSGSTETATPSLSVSGSASLSGTTVTFGNNTSTSGRSATVTANVSGTTKAVTINQAAGSKVYGLYYEASVKPSSLSISTNELASEATLTATGEALRDWTWNGIQGSGGTETLTTNALSLGNTAGYVYVQCHAPWITITLENNTTLNVDIKLNTSAPRKDVIVFEYIAPNGERSEAIEVTVSLSGHSAPDISDNRILLGVISDDTIRYQCDKAPTSFIDVIITFYVNKNGRSVAHPEFPINIPQGEMHGNIEMGQYLEGGTLERRIIIDYFVPLKDGNYNYIIIGSN